MMKQTIYVSIMSVFGVLGWSLEVSAATTECEGAPLVVQGKLLGTPLEKLCHDFYLSLHKLRSPHRRHWELSKKLHSE